MPGSIAGFKMTKRETTALHTKEQHPTGRFFAICHDWGDAVTSPASETCSDTVFHCCVGNWLLILRLPVLGAVVFLLPLYFKRFDASIGARLVENVIISAAGRARDGETQAYNVVPHLRQIQIPTLVMVGRHDFICPPSQAQLLHEGIAGSDLVIFEESGHFPYVEEAEAFFKTVHDWMKRPS